MKRLALIALILLTASQARAATNGLSADYSKGVVLLGSPAGAANCKAATTGAIRYNSTTNKVQSCNGTVWADVGSGASVTPAGSNGQIQFNSNGTALGASSSLYWDDTNKRLGIGTASPAAALEVAGALRLSGSTTDTFVTPQGTSVATKINIPLYTPAAYGQMFAAGVTSAAPTTARVASFFDGRTVSHQPTVAVFSMDENNTVGLSFDGSYTAGYLTSSLDLGFEAGSAEKMRITSGGNVGIGTASPAAKLDVAGAIKLADTGQNCSHASDTGAVRFNSSTTALQFCVNGLGWQVVGGMVPLGTLTASASASLQFTNLPTTYKTLFLNCAGIVMSAQGNGILVRVGEGAGPTWESGATYAVVGQVNTATDLFNGAVAQPSGTTSSQNLRAYLNSVSSSTLYKSFTWSLCQADAYNGQGCSNQGGWIESWWRGDTNPITGLEIIASAGTITSGTCSLYGMN